MNGEQNFSPLDCLINFTKIVQIAFNSVSVSVLQTWRKISQFEIEMGLAMQLIFEYVSN